MRTSVLIPVYNEAKNLPGLLRALKAVEKRTKNLEILFVDNGSTDASLEILRAAQLPATRVLAEPRRGFAEPLNKALAEATGEFLLFLDAAALPAPDWALNLEKALGESDLVVGETKSLLPKKPTEYGKLAAKLFTGHSERAARAQGHALPWGPTCNLGASRALWNKVGPFSVEAAGAFDIDWCWRALLQGARISFSKKAVVQIARCHERTTLLQQFECYGLGEAWLHRTYAFLLSSEDRAPDPLLTAVEAFQRLRYQSNAANQKPLGRALDEVATAFASGIRLGYERLHRTCPLERGLPSQAISWRNKAKAVTVFVAGKGLAELEGKPLQLWEAFQAGEDEHSLVHLFMRLYRVDHHTAEEEVRDFLGNLSP